MKFLSKEVQIPFHFGFLSYPMCRIRHLRWRHRLITLKTGFGLLTDTQWQLRDLK